MAGLYRALRRMQAQPVTAFFTPGPAYRPEKKMVMRARRCAQERKMICKIRVFALLAALSTLLTACDKCTGTLQEFQFPLRPNACKAAPAQ